MVLRPQMAAVGRRVRLMRRTRNLRRIQSRRERQCNELADELRDARRAERDPEVSEWMRQEEVAMRRTRRLARARVRHHIAKIECLSLEIDELVYDAVVDGYIMLSGVAMDHEITGAIYAVHLHNVGYNLMIHRPLGIRFVRGISPVVRQAMETRLRQSGIHTIW